MALPRLDGSERGKCQLDFGKLAQVDDVTFRLGVTPHDACKFLSTSPPIAYRGPIAAQSPQIWIGCPAWSQKEWVGRVYPEGTSSRDFFRHYAKQFTAIELNATHYGLPEAATLQGWKEMAPPDFRFCPKLQQDLSHRALLATDPRAARSLLKDFVTALSPLGPQLGVSFLQLPPVFGPEHRRLLGQFLDEVPSDFPLAVEFRHPGWFENQNLHPYVRQSLAARGVATVITDVAGRRDVSHASLTAQRALVRFVGNSLHASDYARLEQWVSQLEHWFQIGLNEVYFFMHQPDDVLAPDLVRFFVERLNERLGKRFGLSLPVWREWESQASLFG